MDRPLDSEILRAAERAVRKAAPGLIDDLVDAITDSVAASASEGAINAALTHSNRAMTPGEVAAEVTRDRKTLGRWRKADAIAGLPNGGRASPPFLVDRNGFYSYPRTAFQEWRALNQGSAIEPDSAGNGARPQ